MFQLLFHLTDNIFIKRLGLPPFDILINVLLVDDSSLFAHVISIA